MLFKIKLKTKAGNDVKDKQCFNVLFMTNFKKNALTKQNTGYYTFKIIYKGKIMDHHKVFKLKDDTVIKNEVDFVLKVILNLLHVVKNLCEKENIAPDLIMLNSLKLSYEGLGTRFRNCLIDSFRGLDISNRRLVDLGLANGKVFKQIKNFCNEYPHTRFMGVDPSSDEKYEKSKFICGILKKRLHYISIIIDK